jgi:hypothetical protein
MLGHLQIEIISRSSGGSEVHDRGARQRGSCSSLLRPHEEVMEVAGSSLKFFGDSITPTHKNRTLPFPKTPPLLHWRLSLKMNSGGPQTFNPLLLDIVSFTSSAPVRVSLTSLTPGNYFNILLASTLLHFSLKWAMAVYQVKALFKCLNFQKYINFAFVLHVYIGQGPKRKLREH